MKRLKKKKPFHVERHKKSVTEKDLQPKHVRQSRKSVSRGTQIQCSCLLKSKSASLLFSIGILTLYSMYSSF